MGPLRCRICLMNPLPCSSKTHLCITQPSLTNWTLTSQFMCKRAMCSYISLTIMLSHKAMPLVMPDDSAVITFAHGKCRQGCGAQLGTTVMTASLCRLVHTRYSRGVVSVGYKQLRTANRFLPATIRWTKIFCFTLYSYYAMAPFLIDKTRDVRIT